MLHPVTPDGFLLFSVEAAEVFHRSIFLRLPRLLWNDLKTDLIWFVCFQRKVESKGLTERARHQRSSRAPSQINEGGCTLNNLYTLKIKSKKPLFLLFTDRKLS